jgi:hypothetical protein
MAEDIKKLIDTNLKQGLKYTGGKVAPLAKVTIEAKKRKGRRQPDRVFLDSGILFQSLRLVPIAKGFAVTFKKVKYPKSKLSVMEVAQFLVDGTPKMPARPFFGITELQLNKIISRHASARRVTVEPTPRQVEQAGQAIKLITGFDPLKVQVIKSEGLQSVTVSSEKLAVQEVVTTAPKARTKEEVIESLKQLRVSYIDADSMTLEHLTVIEELAKVVPTAARPTSIVDGKGYEKLTGKTIRALRGNKTNWYGVSDSRTFYIGAEPGKLGKYESMKVIGVNSKDFKNPTDIAKAKQKYNETYKSMQWNKDKRNYFRPYYDGNTLHYHESGHLYAQRYNFPTDWDNLAKRWYTEELSDVLQNPSEAWAEAWADLFVRNGNTLPPYIKKAVMDFIKLKG